MAIFTTYLAFTRNTIPKEEYEKYRFIACLGSQAGIICDYTFYSYFQAGIRRKMCFFFGSSAVVKVQFYLQRPTRKYLNFYVCGDKNQRREWEKWALQSLVKVSRHRGKKQTLLFLRGWALMWDCDV